MGHQAHSETTILVVVIHIKLAVAFYITKRMLQAGVLLLGGSLLSSLPVSTQLSLVCIITNSAYSSDQHLTQKFLLMGA